jgi:hypothetical protein
MVILKKNIIVQNGIPIALTLSCLLVRRYQHDAQENIYRTIGNLSYFYHDIPIRFTGGLV